MANRNNPRRRLFFPLFVFSFFLVFSPLQADETRLVRVRKGDTVSYLSFKIYGMYDSRVADIMRRENPKVKDINLIYIGQQLRFPAPEVMKKMFDRKPRAPAAPEKPAEWRESHPPRETPVREELLLPTQVRAEKAVITFLEGEVQVKKAGGKHWSSAQPNMILQENDQVKVPAKSRAELILDNQSVLRLAENTLLSIQSLQEEAATQIQTARMELALGKLWTRAAKLFHPASRYDIKTPTAIAGVQGTIYQVQVAEDRSTKIRVFQGAVNIYNPFPQAQPPPPGPSAKLRKPEEVPGPSEVPGPDFISREQWTEVVLQQFQQITVTEREISRPTPFDVAKERQDEWVRWNEERDADFKPPPRPL